MGYNTNVKERDVRPGQLRSVQFPMYQMLYIVLGRATKPAAVYWECAGSDGDIYTWLQNDVECDELVEDIPS